MGFRKATKKQARLRLALIGPAGSGKTYSALNIAKHLGGRIAVIDTEHGSASKYADEFDFDVMELTSFHPERYIEAIQEAEREGYDILIIDSLSHAWMGRDGALELVDKVAKRSQSGNTFTAWREVTPLHNALVETMLGCRMHLIVTMRAKTEYILVTNEKGKVEPKKVGLAPVQRDGLEYEFDVVADMDLDNNFIVSKSRCKALTGAVIPKPGKEVAEILKAWLSDGAPADEPTPPPTPPTPGLQATKQVAPDQAQGGRPPTEAEAALFLAAGKPEAIQKRLSDRQWKQAVAKYAAAAQFSAYDDLVKAAEALGYDGNEVDEIANLHGITPFDQPGSHTPEQLAAVWTDLLDLLKERQQAASA